jgi:Protein of unknown function (DUF3141)
LSSARRATTSRRRRRRWGGFSNPYDNDDEIVAAGQTIVYCLHDSIGHLGIFVSGKVAAKEHGEFALAMDLIELLPPGLKKAVITGLDDSVVNQELVEGDYLFSLERRGLDDIRALGGNTPADDLAFATVARVSEINQGLCRTFLGPAVAMTASRESAEFLRQGTPTGCGSRLFSDKNPLMAPIAAWAEWARAERRPVAADNPFLAFERTMSGWIADGLKAWGRARDAMTEASFFGVYESPLMQAMVGLRADGAASSQRIERDLLREGAA